LALGAGPPGEIDLRSGVLVRGRGRAEAVRVVHEHVDRPVAADGFAHHRVDGRLLSDVADLREGIAARGADLVRGALRAVRLQLGDADPRALAGEDLRD